MRPTLPVPPKACEYCGTPLERKRYTGILESRFAYMRRRYCGQACAGAAHRQDNPSLAALRKRAIKHRGDACAQCGSSENLGIHHRDGNPANNALDNLMTLCGACHTRWHWEHGKTLPQRQTTCFVCGAPSPKCRLGMCLKHYQRFKKYGSPYLTKKKHGSSYVLVDESLGLPRRD
jgi:hypothetical protein